MGSGEGELLMENGEPCVETRLFSGDLDYIADDADSMEGLPSWFVLEFKKVTREYRAYSVSSQADAKTRGGAVGGEVNKSGRNELVSSKLFRGSPHLTYGRPRSLTCN